MDTNESIKKMNNESMMYASILFERKKEEIIFYSILIKSIQKWIKI